MTQRPSGRVLTYFIDSKMATKHLTSHDLRPCAHRSCYLYNRYSNRYLAPAVAKWPVCRSNCNILTPHWLLQHSMYL